MLNEKPTRQQLSREDTSSTTESLDVFFKQQQSTCLRNNILWLDVPNALIQNNTPPKKDIKGREIMKIAGVLADILLELDSET